MKTIRYLSLAVAFLLIGAAFNAAEKASKVTYRWMDANGIVQYTERPPKDIAYEKITVTASGGKEVTQVSAEEAAQDPQDTTKSAMDQVVLANERNCKIAKQNMEVLQNMARIRVTENGEERILSPEEKQDRIDETQKQIDIYCKPM